MESNKFSYTLANRCWKLLEDESHKKLFDFDKVSCQSVTTDIPAVDLIGVYFSAGALYCYLYFNLTPIRLIGAF